MSYARWSEGDLYVYVNTSGQYVCMDCPLTKAGDFRCATAAEMIDHVQEHVTCGDKVPGRTIFELLIDTEDGLSQGARFRKAIAGVPS